jgi:hypothetical protein
MACNSALLAFDIVNLGERSSNMIRREKNRVRFQARPFAYPGGHKKRFS